MHIKGIAAKLWKIVAAFGWISKKLQILGWDLEEIEVLSNQWQEYLPEKYMPSFPVIFATDPSGAKFPYKIWICPVSLMGFSIGEIIFCQKFQSRIMPNEPFRRSIFVSSQTRIRLHNLPGLLTMVGIQPHFQPTFFQLLNS